MNDKKTIQQFTCALEKRLSKYPFLFYLYSLPYYCIVKKEIKMGDITKKDTVLNVGCGSLPFTAVHVAKMTGAKVVAVDIDPIAIQAAKQLIKRLGLSSSIELVIADGAKEIPFSFNKAIIALQVDPKQKVLSNLLKNYNAHIIMRIPRNRFKSNYGLHSLVHVPVNTVRYFMFTFNKSYLFKNSS